MNVSLVNYDHFVEDFEFMLDDTILQNGSKLDLSKDNLDHEWKSRQQSVIDLAVENYNWVINCGIAQEQIQDILPGVLINQIGCSKCQQ